MEPRKFKLRPRWRNTQTREPWAERAVKLRLLYPAAFDLMTGVTPLLGYRYSVPYKAVDAAVWELIGAAPMTNFRAGLMHSACMAYHQEMSRYENSQRATTGGEP